MDGKWSKGGFYFFLGECEVIDRGEEGLRIHFKISSVFSVSVRYIQIRYTHQGFYSYVYVGG